MVMNYNTYNHIDIEWEKKQWKLYIIFGFSNLSILSVPGEGYFERT
jgi:hypothetical protein